jgi:hypothetical protein
MNKHPKAPALLRKGDKEDIGALVLEASTRSGRSRNNGQQKGNKPNSKQPEQSEESEEGELEVEDDLGVLKDTAAMKQLLDQLTKRSDFTNMIKQIHGDMSEYLEEKIRTSILEEMKGLKEKLLEEMKMTLEGQKRAMMDAELQKTIVAEDLTKRREEKGGYDSLKELKEDHTVRRKMERYGCHGCLFFAGCYDKLILRLFF